MPIDLSTVGPRKSDLQVRADNLVGELMATDSSFLLRFSMPYPTRSHSSNLRWVCCHQEVSSTRRRTRRRSALSHL